MKELFQYQVDGVHRIVTLLQVGQSVLLADHPGAGKTAQAILAARNAGYKNILVVCPASLQENWKREFALWEFTPASLEIFSYTMAEKREEYFKKKNYDLIIFDEAHYLKNRRSRRTKFCLNILWKKAPLHICITGTPLPNGRAIEGYTIFHKLAPKVFGLFGEFSAKYCIKEVTRFGVNYNKSKNLKELGEIAREHFMIRRERAETVGQLPPLIRMTIPLVCEFSLEDDENLIKKALDSFVAGTMQDEAVMSARRLLGISKIKPAIKYIKDVLEECGSCVIFAHHNDVLMALYDALSPVIKTALVHGGTPLNQRQICIDGFQEGKYQVFLASILAANTGITLTKSSNVIFVECDWVPSNNEQAEARCHRISQTSITRSHYLMIPNSLDEHMTKAIIKKQRDIIEVMGN